MAFITPIHFHFIILFPFSIFVISPGVLSTQVPKDGHCVMYDRCEGEFGDAPCVYSGPPKPLDETMPPSFNITAVQLLKELCPDFVQDEDPHVCCSTEQLVAFHAHMMMVEGLGFGRCPSCMQSFRKLVCYMSCSPSQSHFINITRSYQYDEEEEIVGEVNYYVSKQYAYSLYDACKDIRGLTPESLVFDFVCGSWGSGNCNPERWTEFMGSTPEEGAYSPFKTNYILTTEDVVHTEDGLVFYPVNAKVAKCSESPGPGYDKCSCNDCKDSCSTDLLQSRVLEPIAEPIADDKIV